MTIGIGLAGPAKTLNPAQPAIDPSQAIAANAAQIAETDEAKILTAAERAALALLAGTARFVVDPDYLLRIDAQATDGTDYILFGIGTDLSVIGVPAITNLARSVRRRLDPDYVLLFDAPGPDGRDYIVLGVKPDRTVNGIVGDAINAVRATASTALATAEQALAQGTGGVVAKIKAAARAAALRNPIDLPDGGNALATFSTASFGSPPSALSHLLDMQDATQGKLFDFSGGIKVYEAGTDSYSVISNTLRNGGGGPTQPGGQNAEGVGKISFLFDGPSFAFAGFGSYRLAIDGQFITRGHLTVPFDSGYSWGIVTLADQTRRLRLVTIEFYRGGGAVGRYIRIGAADTIARAPIGARLRHTIYGDSFSTATGALERWGGITHILAYLLGGIQADPWITGIGGTGYENDGAGTGADGQSVPQQYKAIDHIQDLAQGFDLIVMALGINDPQYGYSGDAATYQANVLACLQAARAQAPTALIVVAGCWSGDAAPSQKIIDNEMAIKAAWTAWGDGNSLFVPVSTDPSGPWVTAANAATIKDNSADDTHPGDYGHDYLARRLRTAILSQLGA